MIILTKAINTCIELYDLNFPEFLDKGSLFDVVYFMEAYNCLLNEEVFEIINKAINETCRITTNFEA